jgi:hypothetical protein
VTWNIGGRNAREFAANNGINEQTFYNWISKYDRGEFVEASNPYQKRFFSSHFPAVEVELHKFLQAFDKWYTLHHTSDGVDDEVAHPRPPISRQLLQTKAKEFATKVLPPEQCAQFKGGTNWISRYIRRYNLAQKVSMDAAAVFALSEQDLAEIDVISQQINPSSTANIFAVRDADDEDDEEHLSVAGVTAEDDDEFGASSNKRSKRKN